jgi:thioredoxin-like negative regulator of GroEL
VDCVEVDIDRNPELAETFRVTSVPTLVFVLNGSEVTNLRVVGAKNEAISVAIEDYHAIFNQRPRIALPYSDKAKVRREEHTHAT